MKLLDVLLGTTISLDQAEEELGKPEKEEETDLALHVSRCAKRWALSYRSSRNNCAQLQQIRLILLILAASAIMYWPPAQRLVAFLFP